MSARLRFSPEETRSRIVTVAEEHFRRVGYAKTAVADIAAELGMSPANIYRYFPSKAAINDVICQRICMEGEEQADQLAASGIPPVQKLEALILGIHEYNKGRLTQDKRLHEMVEAAMAENWGSIEAHCTRVKSILARVVAEGIAAGAFDPALDPALTGDNIFHACCGLFHPYIIAQCADDDQQTDAQALVAFILRALRPLS